MFNDFMYMTQEMLIPPGYLSIETLNAVMAAKVGLKGKARVTVDDVIAQRRCLIGSPATVRGLIEQAQREMGLGHLLPLMHFGTLPADLTRRNIELFATKVMKPLRDKLGTVQRETEPA
jgi:hypothetical protein